mmetsp:Transcript_42598/g.84298  ORF Transcript_42598/g.84298 Transcript_42598/m.84298 type:complete len:964 (+) Transcript_42598:94-2985(+)
MIEICVQGANLTCIFAKFANTQSLYAEVELDGQRIGRTRSHDGGDRTLRWGESFLLDPACGRMIVFRINFKGEVGVFGKTLSCCGEGRLDAHSILNKLQNPVTVPLERRGENIGWLQFLFRTVSPQAFAGGHPPAGPPRRKQHLGPPRSKDQLSAAAPRGIPMAAELAQAHDLSKNPCPGIPKEQAIGARLSDQTGYGHASPSGDRLKSAAPNFQALGPDVRSRPCGEVGGPAGAAEAWYAQQQQQQQQQRPVTPNRLSPPPAPQVPRTNRRRSAQTGDIVPANPTTVAFEARARNPQPGGAAPRGEAAPPSSVPCSGGTAAAPSALGQPHFFKNGSDDIQSSKPRLNIDDQGRRQATSLMQSKDALHQFVQRPFQKPDMRGRTHLAFREFRTAIHELLGDMMSVPEDKVVQKLLEKHSSSAGGRGVDAQEFEAMIFRLLCFMLASGEVKVSRDSAPATTGAEERDKHWREEFLKKNRRNVTDVYKMGCKLGEGSFGAVYEVGHHSELEGVGRQVRVCKVIKKSSAEKTNTSFDRVREEFQMLKRLDHPHVVRIFEDFEDDQSFYLIMEPARGGDLQDAVRNRSTQDPMQWELFCAKVMQHTLYAVAYCHSRGVIHKDLKPENVMMSSAKGAPLQDVHVVVVDFGLAQMFEGDMARGTEIAGTPPFMAPEVWARNFSKSCDVWSCGVTLFFMLSGTYPFMAQRLQDFPAVVKRDPNWQLIGGASREANLITYDMLQRSEAERPSAQELMKDRWFVKHQLGQVSSSEAKWFGNTLKQARHRTRFEKFVSRLVATQLDAGQLKRVNEAFRAFDADKDGTLSRDELQSGLLMLGATPEEARQTVDELDVGRTGLISYTEFLAGMVNLRHKNPEEKEKLLWLAWEQFNPDKNGLVKTSDIQDALAARGMTVTEMPRGFLLQLQKRDGKGAGPKTMSFECFKDLFQGDCSDCMMPLFIQTFSLEKFKR